MLSWMDHVLDHVKQDLLQIECLNGWEAAARDRASWRMIVDRECHDDVLHREQAYKKETISQSLLQEDGSI